MTVTPTTFQARWEGALTENLIPRRHLWTHSLLNRLLLPACATPYDTNSFEEMWSQNGTPENYWSDPQNEFSELRENYQKFPLKITTPDGVVLTGTHLKYNRPEGTPPLPLQSFFMEITVIIEMDGTPFFYTRRSEALNLSISSFLTTATAMKARG